MNGLTPPSLSAVGLLLQTLLPPPSPRTVLHDLLVEIQDRILEHVSKGPIEAARLGCLLELGSPFIWIRNVDWPRSGGSVEFHDRHKFRYERSPVESKIYFGDTFSGVSYK